MTFVYLMVFTVIVAMSIAVGGGSMGTMFGFIDYPSVVMVVAGILMVVLASGRWADFSLGMKHLFEWRHPKPMDRKTAMRLSRFFRTLSFTSLALGAFWSLIGMIIMLSNFELETLGKGLAIALLTLFYSFFLSLAVFFPISFHYAGMHDREIHAVREHGKTEPQL